MLSDTLNNISELLGISYNILPNIITLIVVILLITISLSSQLDLKTMVMIYAIAMIILTLLGIDSIFNIITLLEIVVEQIVDLIFIKVVTYGY